MIRLLPLGLLAVLVFASAPGCANLYSTRSRALGTAVSVEADYDGADRVLRTESRAGQYPVGSVRLVDARGRVREPEAAVREGPELRGGVRLGTGYGYGSPGYGGLGYGGLGTGIGLGRTVGGHVVPGDYVARFLDPPLGAQPWTLRVTTGGDRAVTTDVLLAERKDPEGAAGGVIGLKLVTGETRRFRTSRGKGGVTLYKPVGTADP